VGAGVTAALGVTDGTELADGVTAREMLRGLGVAVAVAPLFETPSALDTDHHGKQATMIPTYTARSTAPPATTLVSARRPRSDSIGPLTR
jgi:hypothetical protein